MASETALVLVYETDPVVLSDLVSMIELTMPDASVATVSNAAELSTVIHGIGTVALAVLAAGRLAPGHEVFHALSSLHHAPMLLLDGNDPLPAGIGTGWIRLEKPFTETQFQDALAQIWPPNR